MRDLATPRDFWDCGYGTGMADVGLTTGLADLAEALGRPPAGWEAEKFTRGWEAGVRDAADDARERADREAGLGPPVVPPGDEIPF